VAAICWRNVRFLEEALQAVQKLCFIILVISVTQTCKSKTADDNSPLNKRWHAVMRVSGNEGEKYVGIQWVSHDYTTQLK
jgi:hypothetical protein